MKKYQAVIFDLGGTLARSAGWDVYSAMARRVAAACAVPADSFVEKWFASSSGLGLGEYRDYADYISHVCRLLKANIPQHKIDLAAELPAAIDLEYSMQPREKALEVLAYLKNHGYKIGLISDCSPSIPELWPESQFAPYFDVTVFSCNVGINKAGPEIFRLALDQMGLPANACIYVADGMRKELSLSSALGMKTVQLIIPEERLDENPMREKWSGLTINSLMQLIDLL